MKRQHKFAVDVNKGVVMSALSIGKVAKQAGVSLDTVRLYEKYGLIPEPPRLDNGYRQYPEDVVVQLKFIKQAQLMGFTLKEIAELLALRGHSTQTCVQVRIKAEAKLKDVRDKIKSLKKLEKSLKKLVSSCKERKPDEPCPILTVFEKE